MRPITIERKILTAGALLAVLLFVPTPGEAADQCVNVGGTGGCFASIQAAIDAASAGNTVTIDKGVYLQQFDVPVAKTGLTVKGKSRKKVIIDPEVEPFGNGIDVFADGVTLKEFTLRNGTSDGIRVHPGANGTVIKKVTVTGPDSDCINIDDGPTTVDKVKLLGCGSEGIDADAADVSIYHSEIRNCDDDCIAVNGDRAKIVDNKIEVSDGRECIDLFGNDAEIKKNDIRNCNGDGIDVRGNNAVIKKNDIFVAGVCIDGSGNNVLIADNDMRACESRGVDWSGDNPVVYHNSVKGAYDEGYLVDCFAPGPCSSGEVTDNKARDIADDSQGFDIFAGVAGFLVDGNEARRAADEGFDISGTGITIRHNKARDNGGDENEPGFKISGTGHILYHNEAEENHGDGFSIGGTGHTLTDNEAEENRQDGFDVKGATGITLENNEAKENNGVGFEVSSGATATLTGNKAKGNRIPFCNEGVATDGGGNNFTLGTIACVIGD
ncbi:MAG: right-handed parallel beta-helix repeat-containing protein [candidate division NC10 bacterium]|nr:right-handed parallel beta-helix repeat-containing protein [candidate division NC10 bacterium]